MKEKILYLVLFLLILAFVTLSVSVIIFITKENDLLKSKNTYLIERVHYLDSLEDLKPTKHFIK